MSRDVEIIKERLNIADVVGDYVALKRSGSYFKGLCPFHQEKTPSFIVSPAKGIWHCFGSCNEGGDIFSFVQKADGLDFPAALKLLAERAGVQLSAREARDDRARLFDLLSLAARFYSEILLNQKAGQKARDYLEGRGMKHETIEEFGVGYAPQQWAVLQGYLTKKGYSPREMVAAGVVGESQRGKLFDRFRGRIMFPISDVHGRTVAFGGRIVPWHETGQEGKYVNSPETELYSKRRTVYNLARAKQHLKRDPCIVVEGYMDVVMLAQAGVRNVVGTCGTAFTDEHITHLKHFTDQLHFAFDSDAAGLKAAIAATQAALAAGMRVATVTFPAGQDPADVAASTPEKLAEYLEKPRSLVSVLIERLREAAGDAKAQSDYLAALLPLLSATANPVQLGEMIQEVAQLLAIPQSRVVRLLDEAAAVATPLSIVSEPVAMANSDYAAERYVLGLLIGAVHARAAIMVDLKPEFFTEPAAQALYEALLLLKETAAWKLPAEELLSELPSETLSFAEGVRALSEEKLANSHLSPEAEGKALAATLKRRHLHAEMAHLQETLLAGNDIDRTQALKQVQSVAQELARLKTS